MRRLNTLLAAAILKTSQENITMPLYAPEETKADFGLPRHSKDGASSLHPEGQYSLITKTEPYSTLSSPTKSP